MPSNLFAAVRRSVGLKASAAAATFVVVLLWTSPANAGTTITQPTCPVIIATSGDYSLASDVGPCAPNVDGIIIEASAVTLHLNGHKIIGSVDPAVCSFNNGIRVGLVALPMVAHVHILGPGTVSSFQNGVRAENSAGSFVKFLTVTAVCNNVPPTNGMVVIAPGGQWKLQSNVVQVSGDTSNAIDINGVDDNDVIRNDVNNTILFLNSDNNTVVNNTANDGHGIDFGLFGLSSSNNEIHANTANNNTLHSGLSLGLGSTGNNSTGNTAFGNLPFDLEDDNPNCDSNKWQGNHFGTAAQPCIH